MSQARIVAANFLGKEVPDRDHLCNMLKNHSAEIFEIPRNFQYFELNKLNISHSVFIPILHAGDLSNVLHQSDFIKALNTCVSLAVICETEKNAMLADEITRLPVSEFIFWPCSGFELKTRMTKLTGILSPEQRQTAGKNLLLKLGARKIIGKSPEILDVLAKTRTFAKSDAPVMIYGETGTGKELIARAIHYFSCRSTQPFVPVNCAAIPGNLFENELFGHVGGAFTGAAERQDGFVKMAGSGTLFLDEIDSIATPAQAKLLRFIEDKKYKPLGSNKIEKADVRIIAAARTSLKKMTDNGQFRDDLFYRLNVLSLALPPLRQRQADFDILVQHFLQKYGSKLSKSNLTISAYALKELHAHSWPGNIRELENAIHRAVAICEKNEISSAHLKLFREQESESNPEHSFKEAKVAAIESFERNYIAGKLKQSRGNIAEAAKAAGKHRRAFWELMRKHGISAKAYAADELK